VELRRLIPFDASVSNWAIEASLLRYNIPFMGYGAVLGVLSVGETNFKEGPITLSVNLPG